MPAEFELVFREFSALGAHMSRLRELDVSVCAFVRDFTPIGALLSFTTLLLKHTEVRSIEFLGQLRFLKELDLEGCGSIGNFACLGTGTSLRKLSLACTRVADLRWLRDPPLLVVELRLDRCVHVEDFAPIGSAVCRRRLYLSQVLVERLEWLRGLTQLEELAVRGCPAVLGYAPHWTPAVAEGAGSGGGDPLEGFEVGEGNNLVGVGVLLLSMAGRPFHHNVVALSFHEGRGASSSYPGSC